MHLMCGTLTMLEIANMELDKVKRRAARWVLNDYGRFSSVSSCSVKSIIMANPPILLQVSYLDYIHCTKYFIIN